nr:MFS transporter [Actinomycetota bacterium]
GPGPEIGVGASVFAAGIIWWALAVGLAPDYAGAMLGGMLLTGAGVGLTLPTFMATGAASLPPHAFATGSAVINMLRQVGLAVGVAALVAVLGTTARGGDPTGAFQRGWVVIASASLLAAIAGLLILRPRSASAEIAEPGAGVIAASETH